MKSIYNDPAYVDVQKDLHKRLTELRAQYGDSDELDHKFIEAYNKKE